MSTTDQATAGHPRPPGGLYFDPDGASHRDATIRRELMDRESRPGDGYAQVVGTVWKHHATAGAIAAVEAIRDQAQAAAELFGPAILGALMANPKGGLYDEQASQAIRHLDADYRAVVDDHASEQHERYRLAGELLRAQDAYDELLRAQDAYDELHAALDGANERLTTFVVEVRLARELAATIEELVTSARFGGTKTSAAAKVRQARKRAEQYVNDRINTDQEAHHG